MNVDDSAPSPDRFAPFKPRVVSRPNRPRAKPEELVTPAQVLDPESEPVPAPIVVPTTHDNDALEDVDRAREERCEQRIRERAVALAGAACARALHEAIARNPLFVARFVDDAIEAGGRTSARCVRLSPADAAACAARVAVDVVADESLARGEVIVESASGTVGATIDRRAELLVRAVADR